MKHLIDLASLTTVRGETAGYGARIGPGVTLRLVLATLYQSFGGGIAPFLVQIVGFVVLFRDRTLRPFGYLCIFQFAIPFFAMTVFRPTHFISPKYLSYGYPLAAALAAGGVGRVESLLRRTTGFRILPSLPVILAIAVLPLLPGQHPSWAYHHDDWRSALRDLHETMAPHDKVCFPKDQKSYCMVRYYGGMEFFGSHPLVTWIDGPTLGGFRGAGEGDRVWIIRRGSASWSGAEGDDRIHFAKRWDLYPQPVSLYYCDVRD